MINDLYIENYINTEFLDNKAVYDHLKQFHDLLIEYNEFNDKYIYKVDDTFITSRFIKSWFKHLNEIINELFNSFVTGNFLVVTAMTRTLIESYVYLAVLLKEQNKELVEDWFICSTINYSKKANNREASNNIINTLKIYPSFDDKYKKFYGKGDNEWLSKIIKKKRITFRDICKYLGNDIIYEDYRYLCGFVHGQEIHPKILPFTFYVSIYEKLDLISRYIFRSIRLFDTNNELSDLIDDLEIKLLELEEKCIWIG